MADDGDTDDTEGRVTDDSGDRGAAESGDGLGDDPQGLDPADAFSLLSNETRLAVLRVLGEAGEPLTFAELRKAAAPDDTGNFNYHLGKLTGHFVRKTDEGYELRYAGEQVVRAVRAGTMTRDPTLPRERIDERCPYCDAPVEMSYDDERILVRCTECDGVAAGDYEPGTLMNYGVPPASLAGRSREDAVDAAHVLYDSKVTPMKRGVCPECAGRVSISFQVCDDHEVSDGRVCGACNTRYEVWSVHECENCGYGRQSALWFAVTNRPRVVAFYHEHGLEEPIPFRKLTEDNARYVRDVDVTVLGTDPHRFEVAIHVDDETLTLELDDELEVVAAERTGEET